MKSIAKVKQQRRIRNIPPFCDNPTGKFMNYLLDLVKNGSIVITKPLPRRVEKTKTLPRMNRSSN